MRRLLLSALLLLMAAGCVTEEKGLAPRELPFTLSRTTFREVVGTWGNPDSIRNGESVWRVVVANGGMVRASYMLVGMTVSSSHLATRECRLTFDERGILVAARVSDSIPEGATWTLLPW